MLGLILAIIIGIPIAIFNALYKIKYIKYLACLIILGANGLFIYITIVNAALIGKEKSNEWTFSFYTSWIIDFSFSSNIVGFFKLELFKFSYGSTNFCK